VRHGGPLADMSSGEQGVKHRALRALLVIGCAGAALAVAEAATRIIDGYELLPLRLEVSAVSQRRTDAARGTESRKWTGETDALPYVRQLPVATGVEREWFAYPMQGRPDWRPDADLEARAKRYQGRGDLQANYEWNWNYVVGAVCRDEPRDDGELFRNFEDVYVFDPLDGSDAPRFRFLRNATYQSGLKTNAYGWRGPDIPLNKPSRTIRLAFVGASTTIGMHAEPYSYPELVGVWLNRWAEAHHPGLLFESINAGREGVNSRSIQAIVRQELAPIEPDLVVYYEGANQFWPVDFVTTTLPPRSRISGPPPGTLESHSAIARRVESVVTRAAQPGSEPPKPALAVNWPQDLDEHDPDLANPHLPYETQHVLGDLDVIRGALTDVGGQLAIASFVWLVHPGLVLDPVRDALVFSYLNTTYWPFSYTHMRRFLDFQTRAFRKYASIHDLDFVDVANAYPRDPRLFGDAIHMTRAGIYLQAWIVFNGLVPVIERRLATHEWPRSARHLLSAHPAFPGGRRLVPMTEIRAACTVAGNQPSAK
jgi:hypothetical protein